VITKDVKIFDIVTEIIRDEKVSYSCQLH